LPGPTSPAADIRCPRCASREIMEITACNLEIGPPPWQYTCLSCGRRFRVKAPRGPTEEKDLRCPFCQSKEIKWSTLSTEACPPGG
jgi:DNA-directed RNA polymerase subunit RPC12/RpoP